MSRRAVWAVSEGIDGIGRRGWTHRGFQAIAVHHIDGTVEEACDVILEPDVVVDREVGLGVEFQHDVDVTVGPIVAASDRTENGSATNPASTQIVLAAAKRLKGFVPVHGGHPSTAIAGVASCRRAPPGLPQRSCW